MEEIDPQYLKQVAYEGLLRRVAQLDHPTMLKGSFLTRQYMPNLEDRIANDIDFVYLGYYAEHAELGTRLDKWLDDITGLKLDDGVVLSKYEHQSWHEVEYEMADDFPTVQTYLDCTVDGIEIDWLRIDISFNLPVEPGPIPFMYRTMDDQHIYLPLTCPLSLQVAWKLHQTLVRPRAKDFYDLSFLLRHPDFDAKARQQCMQALVNECATDGVDVQKLCRYLIYNGVDPKKLSEKYTIKHQPYPANFKELEMGMHASELQGLVADASKVPNSIAGLVDNFQRALTHAGINLELMKNLPKPTRRSRK